MVADKARLKAWFLLPPQRSVTVLEVDAALAVPPPKGQISTLPSRRQLPACAGFGQRSVAKRKTATGSLTSSASQTQPLAPVGPTESRLPCGCAARTAGVTASRERMSAKGNPRLSRETPFQRQVSMVPPDAWAAFHDQRPAAPGSAERR